MGNLQAQVLNRFESLIDRMTAAGYDDVVVCYQEPPATLLSTESWCLPYIAFDADTLWAQQLSQVVSQKRASSSELSFPWHVTAHYQENGCMSWRLSIAECLYDCKDVALSVLRADLEQLIADLGGAYSEYVDYAEAV